LAIPHSAKGHQQVQSSLLNSGSVKYQAIGSKLGALQTKRIHSDYELSKADVENLPTAKLHVDLAEQLIGEMSDFDSDPDLPSVLTAIRRHQSSPTGAR